MPQNVSHDEYVWGEAKRPPTMWVES